MKARILELISTPEHIVAEDLQLLKDEIAAQPYAQSLRALYLLGTKKYDAENFQKVLATTAAYTTDKKILYQFINGKIYEPKVAEIIPETSLLKPIEEETIIENRNAAEILSNESEPESNYLAGIPEREVLPKIEVDGEVNRILFEGEENFLEEEIVKIDREATEESGVLVTEKVADVANEEVKSLIIIEKTPEKFKEDLLSLKSEQIKGNGNEISNEPEISANSLQKLETIEPENRILEKAPEKEIELPKSNLKTEKAPENKYEIERKRLAEEIEKKMLLSKKTPVKSDDDEKFEPENATVDFFHSQEFSIKEDVSKVSETIIDTNENETLESISNSIEKEHVTEDFVEENPEWKPMNQSDKTAPKSRFSDQEKESATEPVPSKIPEEKPEPIAEKTEEKEVQPMNISFFAPTISEIKKEEIVEKPTESSAESNVPTFINTWQNWLKLDRSEQKTIEKTEVSIENVKIDAIDKFIETSPKISKLKDEVTFTVKEKKDDITHLMTETLAKLFLTQKLYAKAINAYQILQEKHPEKAEEFETRIEEIKILRQK